MSRTNAAGLARGRPRSPFCELTPVDGIAIYSLPRGSFLALPSAWICPASGGLRRGAFHFIEFLRMCGPPRAAISSRWVRRWPSQAVGGHLTEVGVIAAQGGRIRPENRLYLFALMVWSILIVQAFSRSRRKSIRMIGSGAGSCSQARFRAPETRRLDAVSTPDAVTLRTGAARKRRFSKPSEKGARSPAMYGGK
jgi:hypothetical protein